MSQSLGRLLGQQCTVKPLELVPGVSDNLPQLAILGINSPPELGIILPELGPELSGILLELSGILPDLDPELSIILLELGPELGGILPDLDPLGINLALQAGESHYCQAEDSYDHAGDSYDHSHVTPESRLP